MTSPFVLNEIPQQKNFDTEIDALHLGTRRCQAGLSDLHGRASGTLALTLVHALKMSQKSATNKFRPHRRHLEQMSSKYLLP